MFTGIVFLSFSDLLMLHRNSATVLLTMLSKRDIAMLLCENDEFYICIQTLCFDLIVKRV